jgi:hypothetical protein
MLKDGVAKDTVAKKMRIKGLDPAKLVVDKDASSEPKSGAGGSGSPGAPKQERGKSVYGIEFLKGPSPPDDVCTQNREQHLSEEEFVDVFGMYREEYEGMAKWRRIQLKKAAGLF